MHYPRGILSFIPGLAVLALLLPLTWLAAQPANAPFEGRVIKVLDGQALQVLRHGKPVTLRVRDMPAGENKDRIRELVEQQTVTVIVYDRTADGRFIGEVILPTGQSLSQTFLPPEEVAKPAPPPVRPIAPSPPGVSTQSSQAPDRPTWDCNLALGGKPCTYTIPELPGVRLEDIVFSTERWGAATIKGTVRNQSSRLLEHLILTVEWWQYGKPQDTTTSIAVGYDSLRPGGAEAITMMTTTQTPHSMDDYRIYARWSGHPQPVLLIRER